MKKVLFLVSALAMTNSFAYQLVSYDQIKSAVLTGKKLHVVVDISKCANGDVLATSGMSTLAFSPNAIEVLDDHIATSITHFTLGNPHHKNKAVYEFAKFTITPDSVVKLDETTLDAKSYAALDSFTTSCSWDFGGIRFYAS